MGALPSALMLIDDMALDLLEFSSLEWNQCRLLSKALDQGFKLSLPSWTWLAWIWAAAGSLW